MRLVGGRPELTELTYFGLKDTPGQDGAHAPARMSAHGRSLMHCPQALARSSLQDNPLDEILQASSLSHARPL